MQDLPNAGGGAHPEPKRRQPCRPMWHEGCEFGGRGADPSIGPRALETLGTPLVPVAFEGDRLTFTLSRPRPKQKLSVQVSANPGP